MKIFVPAALGLVGLAAAAGAASAAPAYTQTALNLRSGPGTGYPVIVSMPAGAPVDVIDCAGGWCEVAWSGYRGFASEAYLGGGGGYVAPAPAYYPPAYYGAYRYYGPSISFYYSDHDRHRHRRHYHRRDRDHDWRDRDGRRRDGRRGGRRHDRGDRSRYSRRDRDGDRSIHRGGRDGSRSISRSGRDSSRSIGRSGGGRGGRDGGGRGGGRGGDNRGG